MTYWGNWASLFDPHRILRIDEIGDLYQPRTDAPHKRIARTLARAQAGDPGLKMVVVGSRGSGKSTELARLALEVRASWLPIRLDLAAVFDKASSAVDLLVLLAAATERTAREWGCPPSTHRESLARAVEELGVSADSFATLILALEPVGAAHGAPGAALVAGSVLKAVGAFTRQALRELNREGPARERAALIDALNAAVLDLRVDGINEHPALFLVEGLDKLNEPDTIHAAFRDVDLLIEVTAPIVLTAPVAVRHQPWAVYGVLQKFDLWNAAVVDRDGAPQRAGIDEIRGMYVRRAAAAGAPDNLVHHDVLDRAALLSSGNAREFFRLLQASMDRADELQQTVVEPDHLEHAVVRRRKELQIALRSGDLDVLALLMERPGPLPSASDADDLLYQNFIACYSNGSAWFRPNELLIPYLKGEL